MATEIRNRRETGPVFAGQELATTQVSESFRVTSATGMFASEADQAYFWTEEWQKGEREADEDIAAGRVRHFDSTDQAIDFLRGLRE